MPTLGRKHLVILIGQDDFLRSRHEIYEVECSGAEAYNVTTAAEVLEMARTLEPDALALDGFLACGSPDYGVCRALRAQGYEGPVLFHAGVLPVRSSRNMTVGARRAYRLTRGQIDDAAKRQLPRSLREWLSMIERGSA